MIGGMAFRIWETEKQQRALFTNVLSFRDLSLPMLREAVRKFGTEEWLVDDGSYTGKKAETVERKWVPADEISQRPPENAQKADAEDEWGPVSAYPTAAGPTAAGRKP